jgi:phage baseplate assembly protein gpV
MLQAFVFEFALRGLPSRQRLCNPSSHFPLIYSGQQCNRVEDDEVVVEADEVVVEADEVVVEADEVVVECGEVAVEDDVVVLGLG